MAGAEKQAAFSRTPTEAVRGLDYFDETSDLESPVESNTPAGRTRVLFLNRSFWPDREATGQFLTELCDDLSADHEVTIVAGPSYHIEDGNSAGFRLWSRQRRGKVTVIRTRGTRFSKSNLAGRLVNLGTYYLLAAIVAFRLPRPDVIVAETDPPLLGALAAVLKRRWRCRLIYNVRDLYPDIAEVTGGVHSPFLLELLRRGNDYAYERADLIVTLGHDMARRIVDKGVPTDKVVVVPDWVDCGRIHPLDSNPRRRAITVRDDRGGRAQERAPGAGERDGIDERDLPAVPTAGEARRVAGGGRLASHSARGGRGGMPGAEQDLWNPGGGPAVYRDDGRNRRGCANRARRRRGFCRAAGQRRGSDRRDSRSRRYAGTPQADGFEGAASGRNEVRSDQSNQHVRLDAGGRDDIELNWWEKNESSEKAGADRA